MAIAASQELQNQFAQRQAQSESRVNSMFDKQIAAQKQSMETAYNQNLSDQEAAKGKIAPTYQTSANDLAVQYERNRRNLNTQAMARGLNTGTASQQQLAVNQGFMKSYGKLRGEEAQALTEADRQITNLKVNYQAQVQQALADNDYKRAAALMDEYNRNQSWFDNQTLREQQQAENKAQMLASFGDFSGYAALGYDQNTINNMREIWIVQNPLDAYNVGAISASRYRSITGQNPPGAPSGGGGGGGGYYGGAGNTGTGDNSKAPAKRGVNTSVFKSSGGASSNSGNYYAQKYDTTGRYSKS